MVDRTDIDALLIGALYGELTPADEARLMAHLESHPADRTALDNLTRTRAAVRESRILAFQAEPSQGISALLLQEASRRAPRRVDPGETASWFQRFVRSFTVHPAMAAAATLILVIAVTGTFYLRGTHQFAETASPGEPERIQLPAAPAAPAADTEAAAGGAPAADPATGDSREGLAGPSPGTAAGSSAEPARLDELAPAKGKRERRVDSLDPYDGRGKLRPRAKADADDLPDLRAPERALKKVDKAQPARGIELRSPQLTPRDFKDSEKESDEKPASAPRNAAVAGGGAAAAAPAVPPPPPAAASPVPASPDGAAGNAAGNDAPRELAQTQAAPAGDAKRAPSKPAATQQSLSSANNATSAQNDRRFDRTANAANNANSSPDAARQAQLLDWARKQRDQVISLVNSNRCREAASAAVEIYNRAPEYFNANVATDRQIKPCLAYVNDQRDRAERNRATKNAADVQAPAQAAPARK
jgi:anti-sigma factor RsiW